MVLTRPDVILVTDAVVALPHPEVILILARTDVVVALTHTE